MNTIIMTLVSVVSSIANPMALNIDNIQDNIISISPSPYQEEAIKDMTKVTNYLNELNSKYILIKINVCIDVNWEKICAYKLPKENVYADFAVNSNREIKTLEEYENLQKECKKIKQEIDKYVWKYNPKILQMNHIFWYVSPEMKLVQWWNYSEFVCK